MIYLFAGPTISADDVPASAGCTVLPPVSLGDVYRLVEQKPRAIGIIDGYFERTPAVSHKEILWALAQGIHVYGAASMGALRAAELAAFGMVGVGKIFAAYRDGVLEDDDEVAVAHGAVADGYRAASEPMVNIRASVAKALRQKVLKPGAADLLLSSAKSLYYPLRTYPAALEAALLAGLDPGTADRLSLWLPRYRVDQKRKDALALIRMLATHRTRRRPIKASFPFHRTQMWDYAMQECVTYPDVS